MERHEVTGSSRSRGGAGAASPWTLLVLALIFFLAGADPTPRFLGLPLPFERIASPHPQRAQLRPICMDFDLPVAHEEHGATTDGVTCAPVFLAGEPGWLATPPRAPLADLLDAPVPSARDGGCDRNRSGPPRRC